MNQPLPTDLARGEATATAAAELAQQWRSGFGPDAQAHGAEAPGAAAEPSVFDFPRSRWAFSHLRELQPTRGIARGHGPAVELPRAERDDLDGLPFTLADGSQTTWRQALATLHADGVVVLHHGRIVYERYFGALEPQGQHMAMSVTKSVVGLLGAMLVAKGALDEAAPVARYLPELAASGFGQATVRQVMDMTTALHYSEEYTDPHAEVWQHARAGGLLPRPPGYQGPQGYRRFLQTVRASGPHGEAFGYRTVNTDVLGWLIARVSGKTLAQLLSERLWQHLGAEQDACIGLDGQGAEFAGGGLACGLRDLARLGQLLLQEGRWAGEQVVPAAVVADIRRGADPERFARAGYVRLSGWSYRNMWWVAHDAHGSFSAQGIHGQVLHIDPTARMVVARFASHPMAANAHLPTSMFAFRALAAHLMRES